MKTKALISFPVTAKLICVFFFTYAKGQFLYSPVCVEPGQKPQRLVFSQRGSFLSFRAEKSEVLSDDLQSSEKKVDTAKHVYTTTCKKVSASLLSTGTNDLDKRIVSLVSLS